MTNFLRECARVAIKARIAAYLEGNTGWLGELTAGVPSSFFAPFVPLSAAADNQSPASSNTDHHQLATDY